MSSDNQTRPGVVPALSGPATTTARGEMRTGTTSVWPVILMLHSREGTEFLRPRVCLRSVSACFFGDSRLQCGRCYCSAAVRGISNIPDYDFLICGSSRMGAPNAFKFQRSLITRDHESHKSENAKMLSVVKRHSSDFLLDKHLGMCCCLSTPFQKPIATKRQEISLCIFLT